MYNKNLQIFIKRYFDKFFFVDQFYLDDDDKYNFYTVIRSLNKFF